MPRKPTVLLPLNQVRDLLDEIRSAFDITVQLSLAPFTMSFFNDKNPQQGFLGKTRSREEYNNLVSTIPAAEAGHGECSKQASHQVRRAFEDFGDKFPKTRRREGRGKGGQKGTSKQVQKGKEKPVAVWKASLGNLLQTQKYFGLRPEIKEMAPSAEFLPQQDQQKWAAEDAQFSDTVFPPFDVCAPSPHPFEKEVVLIALDVEAYERAHHMITEVGVSTLDTKDIMNISPGLGGENWIKQIRSRHFRIEEYKHLRNKDFVSGNPDGFEFGESEFISLKSGEAVTEVDRCFMFPFSAGFQHDGTGRAQTHEHPDPLGPADRHIVLVGHNTQGDIEYLSKLGSKIFASSHGQSRAVAKHPVLDSIADTLDIDKLYKDLKKEANIRKLGSIVSDLGRAPWGLHNGGNDARYTMECLIGLAIKARLEDDEKFKQAADKEADVAKAQFLDPARTYTTASSSAGPGRGHHYGSDNELDDCSGDEDVEDDYVSDESSDFVM